MDFLALTVIWTVALAFKYSKLWAGYDWRDVFRQPRDRLMFDVAAETIDDARALFDEEARCGSRSAAPAARPGPLYPLAPVPTMQPFQAYPGWRPTTTSSDPVRRSCAVRGIPATVRRSERQNPIIANPPPASQHAAGRARADPRSCDFADAVFRKVQQLALSLSDMDQGAGRDSPEVVEKEISTLESQANPLDFDASEGRVRRLAFLRRQRRALAEVGRKRKEAQEKLDSCRQLLRSMRLELVRFRAGGFNAQPTGLTMVTQQAQSVVRDMGYLSDANAELNAL